MKIGKSGIRGMWIAALSLLSATVLAPQAVRAQSAEDLNRDFLLNHPSQAAAPQAQAQQNYKVDQDKKLIYVFDITTPSSELKSWADARIQEGYRIRYVQPDTATQQVPEPAAPQIQQHDVRAQSADELNRDFLNHLIVPQAVAQQTLEPAAPQAAVASVQPAGEQSAEDLNRDFLNQLLASQAAAPQVQAQQNYKVDEAKKIIYVFDVTTVSPELESWAAQLPEGWRARYVQPAVAVQQDSQVGAPPQQLVAAEPLQQTITAGPPPARMARHVAHRAPAARKGDEVSGEPKPLAPMASSDTASSWTFAGAAYNYGEQLLQHMTAAKPPVYNASLYSDPNSPQGSLLGLASNTEQAKFLAMLFAGGGALTGLVAFGNKPRTAPLSKLASGPVESLDGDSYNALANAINSDRILPPKGKVGRRHVEMLRDMQAAGREIVQVKLSEGKLRLHYSRSADGSLSVQAEGAGLRQNKVAARVDTNGTMSISQVTTRTGKEKQLVGEQMERVENTINLALRQITAGLTGYGLADRSVVRSRKPAAQPAAAALI